MEDLLHPPLLNNAFLETIIQSLNTKNSDVVVLGWTCKPAVPAGTNYLSLLYRINIRYNEGQGHNTCSTNIILKTPLESGIFKEFLEKVNGYEKEVKMYREVLPAMYELYNYRMTAKYLDCPLPNSLALEDLTQQGYKMVDRLVQLDRAHCRMSLSTLARFHAVSVGLRDKCTQPVEYFTKDMVSDFNINYREKVNFNLRAMLRTVDELEGLEKYAEMIRDKINNYTEIICKIYQTSYGLEVLCHGDAWTNNILFKYDNFGEVVDSKLVDFQMSHTSSFAKDILLFWLTSANLDVRQNHKEEMFEVYRMTLNQTLEEVGSTVRLSKEGFDKAMAIYAPYSLEVISGMLTIAMADPEDLVQFDDFKYDMMKKLHEDCPITKYHCSKYYKAILPNILCQVEEFGAFA